MSTKSENRPQKPPRTPTPEPVVATPSSARVGFFQWLFSRNVRQATAMRRHVQKLLNHQRDILSLQARQALEGAIADLQNTLAATTDKAVLEKQMENLEAAANKWLKPYPNA